MSIVLQSSGGGSVTIQEPTTASNFTQTLPAATGTVALLDGSNNLSVSGNLSFNSGYGSSAVAYGCRAWVNFNGTGTVAIRASGNVTSITDNGSGDYTVNFTNVMPDANYSVAGSAKEADSGTTDTLFKIAEVASNPTAGSVRIITGGASTAWDSNTAMVSVFR